MADKKISIVGKIFLIILLCLLLAISGCASQVSREDSNRYVVQTQLQTYHCPECGHPIPMEKISANIREKNECPDCGKRFFGKPVVESGKMRNYQQGYGPYEPRNYGPTSVYQSDVNYQRFGVGGYSFKETSTGFSKLSWYFHDRKVKSRRVTPYWTNTRYHYP